MPDMPICKTSEVSLSKRAGFNNLPIAARAVIVLFGLAGLRELIHALLGIHLRNYASFALMLLLAIVAGRMRVGLIGGRANLSLLTPVVLASLLMLGAEAAVLIAVCGMAVQCVSSKKRAVEVVFNVAKSALTMSMAGIAYNQTLSAGEGLLSEEFVGMLVASFICFLGDSLYLSLIMSVAKRKSIFRVWHDTYLYTTPSYFIAGELSFAAVKLATFHPIALLVLVPVFYSTFYSYRVYLRNLEEEKKHAEEMSALYSSTLSTLALAIDAKDRNTHGHIQRVQKYSRAIAEAMKLEEKQVETIAAAALLHDIGKLAVPDYILGKTGPLTPEEMKKMRLHPQLGYDIISNIKFPYPVANSVLAHHERWDGEGYPDGLKGKEIPLGARVLAVADVFDTVTANRNPDSPETIQAGVEAVREGSGTFFDPEIVAVWESIYSDVIQLKAASAHSTAYRNIELATSEIKILESLADSITGLTGFDDIASAVRMLLESSIPRCSVLVRQGQHEGVPILFGDAVIATISVSRPHERLTDDETRLVTAVAEKISGRLNNAIALETARREATLDELTGIANRRAFERMSTSMEGQNFSIILVDVNAFKAVNDNFGHQAGDATLIRVAKHLQAAFMHAELICRLGGDEFLVVTSVDRLDVRSQIRIFRRMVVVDPAHAAYRPLNFGVSCGVANVPYDAPTIEQAIHLADERMYAVKARAKQWAETPALTM
jgi:diguanylate cyclase (GGDEF)-like protein/putative nucleotidyltransferase with HDIG domain